MKKKFLIIRFSSIGDIILTTPVARILKNQLNAEVHFLTKKAFASLVDHNPNIDKVHTLTEDIRNLITRLKNENYDEIIDLHHNLRSQRIKFALGKPSTSFEKLNIEKWLMVQFKVNKLPSVHIVDRYLKTIEHLGVKDDGLGLDLNIPGDKKLDIEETFGFKPNQYASVVIGAAHQTKCMTAEQIIDLCDKLEMPVILLGGKDEIEKANLILAGVKNPLVKSAVGQFDILQSASIIQQSGPIISHDTGMMHIAAAMQKPQVVVWGNTIPEFGMYPYYGKNGKGKSESFEILGLKCRPCSKLGYERCPKGHFKCMLEHNIASIANNAKLIL